MTSVLREPLLYFCSIGAAAFALQASFSPSAEVDAQRIEVTRAVRAEVERSLAAKLGRAPEPGEAQAALETWKQQEALYREALSLGLAENDAAIRDHLAGKLLYIARERDVLAEPSEAQLREYLEQHRQDFEQPRRFDFEQVLFASSRLDARGDAAQALVALSQGASPDGLGDHFSRGAHLAGMSPAQLDELFGAAFTQGVERLARDQWAMIDSKWGVHAVRVTAKLGGVPEFERLQKTLRLAWQARERQRSADEYSREVAARYHFVVEP